MANDNRFDKIEDKIDTISGDITEIKVIMARNTASLEEHMRRSLANEEAIDLLKEEFKPVRDHVKTIEGATAFAMGTAKILAGAAAAVTIITAILKLIIK